MKKKKKKPLISEAGAKANAQTNQAQIDDKQARSVSSVHDTAGLALPFPLPSQTHTNDWKE